MPEVTENGITFFRTSDLDSFRTISTTGVDEDTTVNIAFTGTTVSLNFDRTKIKDPDVDFNTETSAFQYVADDYLENNPGTINDVIQSYVGQYFSDTVENQFTQTDLNLLNPGVGTRFSNTSITFDDTDTTFDQRLT